jgi:hypothetical protein
MPKNKARIKGKVESHTKLGDREILRQLGEFFGAHPEDVVRSLERFKRELEETKAKIGDVLIRRRKERSPSL